jgi:hypothetical protein
VCAKQSLRQPVREAKLAVSTVGVMLSLTPGNIIRSGYHSWRPSPRGSVRSPVRNDAGRNALSGVKVSSPVKHTVLEWPSKYEAAKATPVVKSGTLGVQVHGMYRRFSQELGRSPSAFARMRTSSAQEPNLKCKAMWRREVRWFHSSKEVE